MNQLKCLPHEEIDWRHDVLKAGAPALGIYGVRRPMTFTVEFLEALNREHLQPASSDRVGIFTGLPPRVPDFA